MLKFKKEQLDFLSVYNFCKSSKTKASDKLYITTLEGTEDVLFVQLSDETQLFTTVEKVNIDKIDFSAIYSIEELYGVIRLCNDKTDIVFSKEGIKLGNSSKYQFESYEDLKGMYNVKIFLDFFKDVNTYEVLELKKFDKLDDIKFCIGAEKFNIFSNQGGYYIGSNGRFLTGAIRNDNDENDYKCFPASIYTLYKNSRNETKNLSVKSAPDNERYVLYYGDTLIAIDSVDNIIPQIFEDNIKKSYEHKYKVEFDKEELISSIKRISVITNKSLDNRVFIKFLKGAIVIENRDNMKAEETIKADVDAELVGKEIVINVHSLINSINSFTDRVILKYEEDANVIKIEDKEDTKFFIANLMEIIE